MGKYVHAVEMAEADNVNTHEVTLSTAHWTCFHAVHVIGTILHGPPRENQPFLFLIAVLMSVMSWH